MTGAYLVEYELPRSRTWPTIIDEDPSSTGKQRKKKTSSCAAGFLTTALSFSFQFLVLYGSRELQKGPSSVGDHR